MQFLKYRQGYFLLSGELDFYHPIDARVVTMIVDAAISKAKGS